MQIGELAAGQHFADGVAGLLAIGVPASSRRRGRGGQCLHAGLVSGGGGRQGQQYAAISDHRIAGCPRRRCSIAVESI